MPFLIEIIVALVIVGLVLWVVQQIPMDPTIARIIRVVVIVYLVTLPFDGRIRLWGILTPDVPEALTHASASTHFHFLAFPIRTGLPGQREIC